MMHTSQKAIYRRVITYILMVFSVAALTTILLFITLGYRYNSQSNTVIQGGLVQFITQPSGASVRVGTADLANKTRSKITLNPGDYTVRMTLKGYRDWEKNITVKSGTVQWLNSARFVPTDPKTESIMELATLGSVAIEENGRFVMLIEREAEPIITLVEANNDTPEPSKVTIPESVYRSSETHRFSLIKQSGDKRHVLVKHDFAGGQEWLMADVEDPARSFKIADEESRKIVSVQFDPSSDDRAYALYDDGSVRQFAVDDGTMSEVLVGNVANLTLTSSGMLFFATKAIDGVVETGYLTRGKTDSRTIGSIKTTEPVSIAAGEYAQSMHIATAIGPSITLRSYEQLPASDSEADISPNETKTIITPTSVQQLSFKAGGRFVVASQPTSLSVYDIELEKQSNIAVQGADQSPPAVADWLDGFHFWSDADGSVRQYEFDGSNQESIVTAAKGYDAGYSDNDKYLYSVGKTESGLKLQRTLMEL